MDNEKRALFGRKMNNLDELKDATFLARENGQLGSLYEVIREIRLDEAEFIALAQDFFKEQPWIEADDGGSNDKGEIRCTRVVNTKSGERILINSEGYDYCRYTALELDSRGV